MKPTRLVPVLFSMLLAFVSTANAAGSTGYFEAIKKEAPIKSGESYYMRHNLMFEKDSWDATNYWRGTLLQINTPVKVVAIGGNSVTIAWEGFLLKLENGKYTKVDTATLAKRMLSRTPVSLENFDESTRNAIRAGTLSRGMTREQIIMTRGYPPAHKTPNIDADNGRWMYWSSRFVYVTYVISGGILTEGRDL